jgi:hypothetical protein
MTDLHIPDLSEYQTAVDFAKLATATPAVILRAHNGARPDRTFAARLPQARAHMQVRLFYGYCRQGVDAGQQGRQLAQTVGALQPGEAVVCDLEEGDGDQSGRLKAYLDQLGGVDIDYSGEAFARAHLKGVGLLFWIAAYRGTEPTDRHFLWQNTDHQVFPGVSSPCDSSIFHGTVADLKALLAPHGAGAHAQAASDPKPVVKDSPSRHAYPLPAGAVFHQGVKHPALDTVYRYFAMAIPTDHSFTAELTAKISHFQATHRLNVPTRGVVDLTTWKAMT